MVKVKTSPFPVDIVMITWHRPEITNIAIKAIRQNTKSSSYRLVVIDNGSPRKMQDMLKDLYDQGLIDQLVLNEKNVGLEPARNQGMEYVSGPYFICADNDCLPPRKFPNGIYGQEEIDWVEKLVDLMERNLEYGAISCRTQVMIGTGNIFEDDNKEITDFPHPGGSLRIMQTEAVKKAGLWRSDNPGRGQEERYICGKLHELGYRTGFATNIHCLHLFGDKSTDRWGYDRKWKPEKSGHSDISHPALEQGDDPEMVKQYYDI